MKMSIVNTGQTLVNVKLIRATCFNTARKAVVSVKHDLMDKLGEHCYKFNRSVHAEQTSKTCPSNSVTDFYMNCISQFITRNHEFSTL